MIKLSRPTAAQVLAAIMTLAVVALPSVLSLIGGGYLYAFVIWPVSVVIGVFAVALVPPGVAVLIFLHRTKRLDKITSITLSDRNRREVWVAAVAFVILAAWLVTKDLLVTEYAAVSIPLDLAVSVVILYALGRYRFRRHHIGVRGTMVVDPR